MCGRCKGKDAANINRDRPRGRTALSVQAGGDVQMATFSGDSETDESPLTGVGSSDGAAYLEVGAGPNALQSATNI
jgi:hypothetical protein